ncbi:MAG: SCO family protein [Cytophagaceae bacterium]|nr:SCO family protein [Cytophagaceae bacterium]
MKKITVLLLLITSFTACQPTQTRLPILGEREGVETRTVNGQTVTDTVYHTIPDFAFVNQDSAVVSAKTFENKIYVANFFFTTCPTICPKMQTQLLKVYQEFKGNPGVMFLSHSIDPRHDTVPVLREYAKNIGAEGAQWQFVTGDKAKVFEIAQKSYFVSALEDENEPGGLVHSGALVLIDQQKRIRGLYDSTEEADVNLLKAHIRTLLAESQIQ